MSSAHQINKRHSKLTATLLKLSFGFALAWLAAETFGQANEQVGKPGLRAELTRQLESGQTEAALRRAQTALRAHPNDAGVRREYANLHLTLARNWLAQRRYDDCLTALGAVLAIQPDHMAASEMRAEILSARRNAARGPAEVERLLRIELFEAAFDLIKEIKSLRPDLATSLAGSEATAWLGAADDHYTAKNFHEAFALYENALALSPDAAPHVHSRWAISLGLAISESDFSKPADQNATGRLLARAIDVLRKTDEPIVGQILAALLAERAGHLLEAGRTYAEALGEPWALPPADQRRSKVARLRRRAIVCLRRLYDATPTQRRSGSWAIALPDVWKHHQTAHFDIYARNDLIAERIADAAEYHFAGISTWLGVTPREPWTPRCELRVHATMADLHRSTNTKGVTRAISHTRLQGGRILLRKLEVFQADPWLLCSTLPHELTHVLLTDACRTGKLPLALDEGIALQSEPPARRLQFRLQLAEDAGDVARLLATQRMPANQLAFYARCDALTSLLLHRLGERLPTSADAATVRRLLDVFCEGVPPEWWTRFGWSSSAAMQRDWQDWYIAGLEPPRMPLMILTEPSPEHLKRAPEDPRTEP